RSSILYDNLRSSLSFNIRDNASSCDVPRHSAKAPRLPWFYLPSLHTLRLAGHTRRIAQDFEWPLPRRSSLPLHNRAAPVVRVQANTTLEHLRGLAWIAIRTPRARLCSHPFQ